MPIGGRVHVGGRPRIETRERRRRENKEGECSSTAEMQMVD